MRHLNFCSWASPVRAPWSPLGSLWSPLGLPGGPWDTPGTTFEVLLHLSGPFWSLWCFPWTSLGPLLSLWGSLWMPFGLFGGPVASPWITFGPLGCPFRLFGAPFGCPLAPFSALTVSCCTRSGMHGTFFSEISPGPSPEASRSNLQMLLEASQLYFSIMPPRCFQCIHAALQDASRWASLSPCYLFHYPIPLSQLFHGTLCESDSHSPQAERPNYSKRREENRLCWQRTCHAHFR